MDTLPTSEKKPHVICIPLPLQSHVKCMLKMAQLLHQKGLQITFVNTEFIHKRLLSSCGILQRHDGSNSFRFETIPDGIPRSSEDDDGSELLSHYVKTHFLTPFLELATKLPSPPTLIISDGFMTTFTIDASEKLSIPIMLYWPVAACGFMSFYQIPSLIEKELVPLKDESYLTNGFLETVIDWIPGMKEIQLKHFPSIVQTTDPKDNYFRFCNEVARKCQNASHIIIHSFNELEASITDALSSMFPHVYTIGPLQLLLNQMHAEDRKTEMLNIDGYSLWKEDTQCLKWLDSKDPNSVVYVNFGTTTIMSLQDLIELGWGLANSNHYFLWIIRLGLVAGESAVLPPELEEHIKKRGFIASWCSQEKVLDHPSVGGFLTHGGWASVIESLSAGVPMICRPFMYDQITNCWYVCKEWGVGLEMGKDVKREEVRKLVHDLMGEGGQRMRDKALEWKEKARITVGTNGSSSLNVNKLVQEIIML